MVVVDDHVPARALGAGFPRSLAVLTALASGAASVVLCATQEPLPDAGAAEVLPHGVSVFPTRGRAAVRAALEGTPGVLWVSRPANLALVEQIARREPAALAGWRIVYDAEAIFALRTIARHELHGEPVSDFQRRRRLRQELRPAEVAQAIVAVTAAEAEAIASCVAVPVTLASMPAPATPTPRAWADRRHLLFIGPVAARESPNGDALAHFVSTAMPEIAAAGVRLRVAGRGAVAASWLDAMGSPHVDLLGPVDDVEPLYDQALAFVAPLRFGAGMPCKIVHAAQHGLPTIASTLAARQVGWHHGRELLVADDAAAQAAAVRDLARDRALWTSLREGALAALARDHAPERFAAQVRAAAFPAAT